ncbi:MAG: LutC/YkgG family protein [Hyphomicrobiaceae bacterium]
MTDARTEILSRIRKANGSRASATEIAQAAADLLKGHSAIQPKFPDLTNRQKFIGRATSERLTATVDEIAHWDTAVAAIRGYLVRSNIPLQVAVPPVQRLADLDWGDVERHDTIAPNEVAAVGVADYAIAETGTLVFSSRPDSPTLFNFLGLHHVVLVEGARLLRYMEDYWQIMRDHGNIHPRSINFITGTSGTADIEAKNTRGAHGPRYLHIIVVGDDVAG